MKRKPLNRNVEARIILNSGDEIEISRCASGPLTYQFHGTLANADGDQHVHGGMCGDLADAAAAAIRAVIDAMEMGAFFDA